MEILITYGAQIIQAFVSPINCVGNLGADVLHSFGNFAQCVGTNLGGSIAGASETASNIVATVGTTVGSIGA